MSIQSVLRSATPPAVAVEFASTRLSAAKVERRSGKAVITAHAAEPLPDGALVASLTAPNIHDRAAVIGALGRLFDRLGTRPRRIGIVVPDPVAKVSLVRFEQVPARHHDLEQLVRWQVKKTAPFAVEDAQLSYMPGSRTAEGQEFVVSIAKRDIVESYESVCAEIGAHAGIVDLATFNVVNAVLAGGVPPSGDWLLVNIAPDYASLAILRGTDLIFFRNRTETDGTLEDLVHQASMYYEDRLGGGAFERVLLAGAALGIGGGTPVADATIERLRRGLEERIGRPVQTVDPRAAATLTDRITAGPALLDSLTPLVGLLLRGREAA